MFSRSSTSWMWAEACQLLDQAERLHRQFFRLGVPAGTSPVWEPPVDVLETEDELIVVIALPGVPLESIELTVDSGALMVRAARPLPLAGRSGVIRRLEIPYGYFERRIDLPRVPLRLIERELVNGCLFLNLQKAAGEGVP